MTKQCSCSNTRISLTRTYPLRDDGDRRQDDWIVGSRSTKNKLQSTLILQLHVFFCEIVGGENVFYEE